MLFSLSVLVVVLFIEWEYRSIPNDYSYKSHCMEKNKDKIKVLVLGASHCYRGVNPAYFDMKCFNLSLVSQSIDYDYYILEKYIQTLSNLEYVILPVNYITFSYQLEDEIEYWRKYRYIHFMHMNSKLTVEDLFTIDRYLTISQQSSSSVINHLFRHWAYDENHISCDTNGWGFLSAEGWDQKPLKMEQQLILAAKEAADKHKVFTFDPNSKNMEYFSKIIQLCEAYQCKLILMTPPASSYYVNNLDVNQWNRITQMCDSIDTRYDHVRYLNFIHDTSFTDVTFADGDHLNHKGAKILSQKLNQIIKRF